MVKIVTDSTADLPLQLANDLDITVVPAYIRFGDDIYRDRIDISDEEFYQRLLSETVHPTTEPPTPEDFADVYHRLSKEADAIISIHISSKLSATYNSALKGKALLENDYPIEVIDSQLVTMGLGLLTTLAASFTKSEHNLQQIVFRVKQSINSIHLLGLFDTLKFLALGGRIGKAKSLLGSVLNIKPMLTMRDGELEPYGQVRSRHDGINKLIDFVTNSTDLQDVAVVHSTTPDDANILVDSLGSIFPKEKIKLTKLGPVLGVHAGPGILFIALRENIT